MMTRVQRALFGQWLRQKSVHAMSHTLCLPVALSCVFPLLWMIASSLKTQQTVFKDYSLIPVPAHFGNYLTAWTKGSFDVYFLNSLMYTSIVVAGVLAFSSMAAYAFSRFSFPWKGFLYKLLLSTMLVPIPGSFVALYILLTKMHLTEIWAEALEANVASIAILRRLGMRETGLGAQGEYSGTVSRYRQFSLAADDFHRMRGFFSTYVETRHPD